ncbi:MAG: hypothetical protein GWN84_22540 [Gammaproteobacteria bacterium]|nr:hypothetical protein [Gammaproteobacteria bacterium]NIR85411.1 hypothetical protein [Gammaproteobacteria bacterium]NIR89102.1 hypothetical protein [Gammaproteobacteria bacterium]NIU06547.1 hypothetical protein [Gammaproteobacteria bacterium]NIV53436.1 hypothetical protein [Gammaproteobacteria bacterium]
MFSSARKRLLSILRLLARRVRTGVVVLACSLGACTPGQIPYRADAPYVWLCSVASGGSRSREQIRCWGVHEGYWVEHSRCAEFERPENLVVGQSYPLVPGSALFPRRARTR